MESETVMAFDKEITDNVVDVTTGDVFLIELYYWKLNKIQKS